MHWHVWIQQLELTQRNRSLDPLSTLGLTLRRQLILCPSRLIVRIPTALHEMAPTAHAAF